MYNIIPLVIILISFFIIIVIILKKFPALASLDTANIKAEREAKIKEQIISGRLKRKTVHFLAKIKKWLYPLGRGFGNFLNYLYKRLQELKERYKNEQIISSPDDSAKEVEILFREAEDFSGEEEWSEAEKRLIKILSLDSKNIAAFKALGEIYIKRKSYEEAEQTFKHILKLYGAESEKEIALSEDSQYRLEAGRIYFCLANVCLAAGKNEEALRYIKEAVGLEENNPRYLDSLLEISIINKDKVSALDAHKKLKEVNPENKKLLEFKRQIGEL